MTRFPGDVDPQRERLAALVFALRREVFMAKHYRRVQERVDADEEQECLRDRANEAALRQWDEETRQLILGTVVRTDAAAASSSRGSHLLSFQKG